MGDPFRMDRIAVARIMMTWPKVTRAGRRRQLGSRWAVTARRQGARSRVPSPGERVSWDGLSVALVGSGALLLFVVQPLWAKRLLPVFGGDAGVWLASLLAFQALLLAGYAGTHRAACRTTLTVPAP